MLRLVDDAWNNLEDDGYFITSGIIEAKQQLIIDKLLDTGFNVVQVNQIENWVSIIAQKKKEQ